MPLQSPTPEQMKSLEDHVKGQGKIAQLIQLRALGWLNGNEQRQAKVDEAERNWYIRQLGESVDKSGESDDMGATVLGDINHPAPVVISQPPQQSNLMPLALLALAAAIPATGAIGVAGYLRANRDKQPAAVTHPGFDDSTVKIGLGRIEDLD